ncbi:MAG TPA: ATP-binding protein [Qipengyuania sp.]|nr:ATP-binding protein [Qipengyuania sp.]
MPDSEMEVPERGENRERRLVVLLLAAGAMLLVIAVLVAARTMFDITEDTAAVEHTLEVESTIAQLTAESERIETARRGYLIQPGVVFASTVRRANNDFDRSRVRLQRLVEDNPVQVRNLNRVMDLDRERDARIENLLTSPAVVIPTIRAAEFDSERGVVITRELRTILGDMARIEQRLLNQRSRSQLDSLVTFYVTGGLAIALMLVVLLSAMVVVLRYNRELTLTQARLRIVNEGLEDAVAARTTELSRANEEIQRFAYIVSHDLRSPLVNVLGFTSELDQARKTLHDHLAKLYEKHPALRDDTAWLAVEEDLPEALGFIRASTEKMDRLINSILELSRQGRRTLKPQVLDMTAVAETIAATMHQRAEAAGAAVEVAKLPGVESDRIAVEQILSNLVENALKYLSPSRAGEVRVEGRRKGKQVEYDVVDNGRGIAPADHERIFDLFRRAGSQDQPGEGIGLANVRALAYRLGGRIAVESQLDQGARFTLILPEKFPAELAG